MTTDKDKILLRAKDVSMLIMVLTLLSLIIGPMKKIFRLDEMILKVEKLDDQVADNTKNIAVINAQYTDINRQLEQINWQLRRMRSGRE